MQNKKVPFNVSVLKFTPEMSKILGEVTSLDYYESTAGELHDQGLFSIPIFGRIGDELRDQKFGFIDIKVEVLHPAIYDALKRIRALYKDILAGSAYAVWNPKTQDFDPSNELEGQTGFAFFMEHFSQLKLEKNQSISRNTRIDLIEKYRDRATTSKILVLPAGLRDIEEDESGRKKVGEINDYYRKLLATSRSISVNDFKNADIYNGTRHTLQMTFNAIYEFLETMLSGKKGFYQDKWGRRRIFNSTRNVISAMDVAKADLDDPDQVKFTDTAVGLYQGMKSIQPLAIHAIKTRYLEGRMASDRLEVNVVDRETLESRVVRVHEKEFDRWMTIEGLEKTITEFGVESTRHLPVEIGGGYMALIYVPPNEPVFKVFYDIRDLPEGFDRNHVRPITLVEFFYLSCYPVLKERVAFATRYPVTGIGSIYPSTLYIKTTLQGERRSELNDNWELDRDALLFPEFPTYSPLAFYDVMAAHPSRLALLGADHDGDTLSFTTLMTDEGTEETKRFLKTKAAWVDPNGQFNASVETETVALVFKNMSMAPPTQ